MPGTSYSVPSTNYEVPTQSIIPSTNYDPMSPPSVMGGGYSAPSTRYDAPGQPVMTYAAPMQSAELTPASTFATTFTTTTNEVPSMTYAAPIDHAYGTSFASPEPISTGAFLATHPELDGTARAFGSPEAPGFSTPLATTPARSETPTTLVGATLMGTAPVTPRIVSFAPGGTSESPVRSVRQVAMPSKVVKDKSGEHCGLTS